MQTPVELAHHLNLVRQNQTDGEVRRIPDVGYNVFKKNFEEPTKAEGFSEIVKVDFVPHFDSMRDEQIFRHWTTGGH
jgi:bifunctional polynucleotide phosphatase/kinase